MSTATRPNLTVPAGAPARAHTALIVVDAQNDFVDPAGALSVGGAPERLPAVNRLVDAATAAGWLVVLSADWHPERTPHFQADGGPWPPHCVAGTWGAELHGDLRVPEGACIVRKGTGDEDGYSAFSMVAADGEVVGTGLAVLLGEAGVTEVVVAGFATDYCVAATAVDAAEAGFDVRFVEDAAAAVNVQPGDDAAAIDRMVAAGVAVVDTATVVEAAGAGAR